MAWAIEFDPRALAELRALDRSVQRRILRYLEERLAPIGDPRAFGKPLRGPMAGLWRYRVDDHRLVCRIEDGRLTVVLLHVGHRSTVYDR
ncbi:MAG TPA: type II toxin-antitoxin system RelE/ParE family toxin [Azospirillum sp.]